MYEVLLDEDDDAAFDEDPAMLLEHMRKLCTRIVGVRGKLDNHKFRQFIAQAGLLGPSDRLSDVDSLYQRKKLLAQQQGGALDTGYFTDVLIAWLTRKAAGTAAAAESPDPSDSDDSDQDEEEMDRIISKLSSLSRSAVKGLSVDE